MFDRPRHAEHHEAPNKAPRPGLAPAAPSSAISSPSDPQEREAEAVADQVMRGLPVRPGQAGAGVQRKCTVCGGDETGPIHAKHASPAGSPRGMDTAPAHRAASQGGDPLPGAVRAYFEPLFGQDFSQVRVHTGTAAAQTARGLNANAYTIGKDIVFDAGHYDPHSPSGRRLLAHELTHTVQQKKAPGRVDRDKKPDDRKTLIKKFKKCITDKQYGDAAIRLNGFNDSDINTLLDSLETPDLKAMLEAAPTAMPGWDGRVTTPGKPILAERERVIKYKSDYDVALAEARKNDKWDDVALKLNGFSLKDIEKRANDMTVDELKKVDAIITTTFKDWPDRVHPIMRKLLLSKATADGAAPGTATRESSTGASKVPDNKKDDKRWQTWVTDRDSKARTLGAADYEDYVANMLKGGGAVLGRTIPTGHPVHPLFMDKLERATNKARALLGNNQFGVGAVSGQDNRPGNHAWGLAVDIDAGANPYILNEAQDKGIDALTTAVYERIAQSMLKRATILTPATKDKPSGLQGATWKQLAEENDAMMAYFGILRTEQPGEEGKNPKLPAARDPMSGKTFAQADLDALDREQVRKDYLLLTGKGTPADAKVSGDFPFAGAGAGVTRDPSRGFLTLKEAVAQSLQSEGMRWGATDFAGASGDVMHFDCSNHSEFEKWGQTNQTSKRKAE